MEPFTSWERQCHSRARRAKRVGRREFDSPFRCSSGPKMNVRVGEERGACTANVEVEVHFFAWRVILSSGQKCRWVRRNLCSAAWIQHANPGENGVTQAIS